MPETQIQSLDQEDPWIRRSKWQPTPIFLSGESYGQRSLAGYSLFIGSQRVRHDWATKHSPAQKGAAGSRHTMVGSLSPPGATVCNVSFTLGNNCEALEFRQRLHQQGHVVLVQRVFVPKGKRSPQSLDLGPGDKRLTVAEEGFPEKAMVSLNYTRWTRL